MAGSCDKEWALPEMHAALILLRSLIPCHELRRIISEVECEGWAVLDTPEGDISFQEDDIPMLRKILGKRKEERYGAED